MKFIIHKWTNDVSIAVFKSKYSEMEWVVNRSGKGEAEGSGPGANDNCVRLRGLPFDCTKSDVSKFFDGKYFIKSDIFCP